jgi:predicted lactoylglutathione lyase
MIKQIFVNLPVQDLAATKEFWTKLGFSFNSQFTNQDAAALVLADNIFAMLIVPSFFQTFTKKPLADASTTTEVINALGVATKSDVDTLLAKALAAGATETREAEDHGWMYGRSFADLDGHQWEVTFVDIAQAPATPGQTS